MKGKTTASKPPIVEREDIAPIIQREQTAYIDIMFVNNNLYLVCLYNPSEYLEVRKLKGKSEDELALALNKSLNFMERSGFNIRTIRCDGETGIESESLRSKIKVNIDTTGGEHVGIIERKIRTIKERIRGTLSTLPYRTNKSTLGLAGATCCIFYKLRSYYQCIRQS